MEVKKTTTTKSETSSTLDLTEELKGLPKDVKLEVLEEVGEYLIEQTLLQVRAENSPVQGEGKFSSLISKEYKSLKKAEVGNTRPNLELSGEMLDSLDYKISGNNIKIGVYGTAAPRADGHNNLSGESDLPKRRFLPDEGQSYKAPIKKEIDRIIADKIAENTVARKADFKGISSKGELYNVLKEIIGDMPRSELRLAALRSDRIMDILLDLDLELLL